MPGAGRGPGRLHALLAVGAGLAAAVTAASVPGAAWQQRTPASSPIVWSADRPLTWSDYRGVPQTAGPATAITAYRLVYEDSCTREEFTFRVTTVFEPDQSWVRPGLTSGAIGARLLAHEQGHFDLAEAQARALRRALWDLPDPCGKTPDMRRAIVGEHMRLDREAQDRYDWETGYGTDERQQTRWLVDIARRLAGPWRP